MSKYPTILHGEWFTPKDGSMRLACCDCGLVHDLEITTETISGEPAIRLMRNNRATAGIRRQRKA